MRVIRIGVTFYPEELEMMKDLIPLHHCIERSEFLRRLVRNAHQNQMAEILLAKQQQKPAANGTALVVDELLAKMADMEKKMADILKVNGNGKPKASSRKALVAK